MADPFTQHIVPIPQTDAEDILILHQMAYEFRDEVNYRNELEQYYLWYQQTAEQHRQELMRMQQDFSVFRWLGLWK